MPIRFKDINDLPVYELDSSGGFAYRDQQVVPFALVGFAIRHGALVDAVTPLYRELKPNGTLSEIVSGGHYGGMGGDETFVEMPGYVVVGLVLSQGALTDSLAIIWQRWTAQGVDVNDENISDRFGGSGGIGRNPIKAVPGGCAIGIHGKAGGAVDRISLITAHPIINK